MEKIASGSFATLSTEAVISAIRDELKIETTDSNFSFRRWTNEAVRHLDCLSIFVKRQGTIPVENGIACLPAGLFRLIAMSVGEACPTYNSIYVDTPYLQLCGCDTNQTGVSNFTNSFEIQDNNLVFHSNFSEIEQIQVAFLGLNVNDSGLMKIYTDMERALVAYNCWKYTRQNFKEYPQYIQQSFKSEWIAQKKWIKSIDFQNDYRNTRRQILEWMNAIIVDKTFTP